MTLVNNFFFSFEVLHFSLHLMQSRLPLGLMGNFPSSLSLISLIFSSCSFNSSQSSVENGFMWKSSHVTECRTRRGSATFQSPFLNTLDLWVSKAVLTATLTKPVSLGWVSDLFLKQFFVSELYLKTNRRNILITRVCAAVTCILRKQNSLTWCKNHAKYMYLEF